MHVEIPQCSISIKKILIVVIAPPLCTMTPVRTTVLTAASRTETSSLSLVVRDDGDKCSVPLSGLRKVSVGGGSNFAVEQPQLYRKH